MRKMTQLLLAVFCLSLTWTAQAQEKKEEKNDSYYLAGAVPEVDGKVVFKKEFQIPGMNQNDIFNRVEIWMKDRLKKNQNNSRIVYTDKVKGQIVGIGQEWIVFRSSALSLDRTEINYQLTASCYPEKCVLEIEKIRFEYREGEEKYTAEEWITDKYALNKSKTKLVRGLAKWRRKTVDFADNMGEELATALSVSQSASTVAAKQESPQAPKNAPVVIAPQQKVIEMTPLTPSMTGTPEYAEVNPAELSPTLIQMGAGKLVLVIGSDEFNMTMMTANAGGSLGKMSGKPVVFSFLSPDQPYEAMENAGTYTVRFYPAGQNQPSVILECKKLPSQAPLEGQPRMYAGEIIKAKVKK